jgi:hypothetical protein
MEAARVPCTCRLSGVPTETFRRDYQGFPWKMTGASLQTARGSGRLLGVHVSHRDCQGPWRLPPMETVRVPIETVGVKAEICDNPPALAGGAAFRSTGFD